MTDDSIWSSDDDTVARRPRDRRPPRASAGGRSQRPAASTPRPGDPGGVASEPSLHADLDDVVTPGAGHDPVSAGAHVDEHVVEADGFDDAHDDLYDDDEYHDDDYHDEDHHDDDVVDLPSDKLPRWVLVIGVLVVVAGLCVGGVMFWYNRQVNPPGSEGAQVVLSVPNGASMGSMGDLLANNGVVSNAMVFNFWASRKHLGRVQAGYYTFRKNMSFDAVRTVIDKGPTTGPPTSTGPSTKVLVREGLTVDEITKAVASKVERFTVEDLTTLLDSEKIVAKYRPAGQTSYEGMLFPATYDVGSTTTATEFLTKLTTEMTTRIDLLSPEGSVKAINERYGLDLTVYDVVTVASLVERESGGPEESANIASVIYNRLATGKDHDIYTLGIDAVDRYGANLVGMTLAQYQATDQPYNTRKVAGLPPTPIGAPGDASLKAAFAPADTPFYYYVLKAPGVHTFVETKREFDVAKAECQRAGLC
jgi:UPF0755 protein